MQTTGPATLRAEERVLWEGWADAKEKKEKKETFNAKEEEKERREKEKKKKKRKSKRKKGPIIPLGMNESPSNDNT